MTFNYIKDANLKDLSVLNYDSYHFSKKIKLNIYKIYIVSFKKNKGAGLRLYPTIHPLFGIKMDIGNWKIIGVM